MKHLNEAREIGRARAERKPVRVRLPATMDYAFTKAMVGKQYGVEETKDACAWFAAGWRAREAIS